MKDNYYTTEQAAELLKMHPKTIQRYIREGKLRANKIGKSWLITGHDLSVFAEGSDAYADNSDKLHAEEKPYADRVKISAVADIEVKGKDEAIRIMNTLTAAMNCKPAEYGASTLQVQHIDSERKVRAMLWGNPRFMEAMMGFIAALTDIQE